MRDVPIIPMGDDPGGSNAAGGAMPRPWQTTGRMSSVWGRQGEAVGPRLADDAELFLARAGFDRAPWLAVIFAGGIGTWFALPEMWQWCAAIAIGAGAALAAFALWPRGSAADEHRAHLRLAVVTGGLVFAFGIAVIWARSEMVGAEPLARPAVE